MATSADDPQATQASPASKDAAPAEPPPPGAETVPNATPGAAQATAAFEPLAGAAAADDATLPTIAGYEILGELGRGGMGVVYKARHLALRRVVALKMILTGRHAGGAEQKRFLAEAEAIARLVHPHVIQIFEIGEQEGQPFFSLEYCPGGGLDRKLNGQPLPPRDAAVLTAQLAGALQAAHDQ